MKMVHFYKRLELRNDGKLVYTLVSTQKPPYNGQFDLSINFSNDDTPSTTDITVHGLTKAHSDLFEKGSQVDIYAGYFNSDNSANLVKHCVHGTITTIDPRKNDSGDWQLTFTMQDGEKYDDMKPIKVKDSKKVRLVASQKSLESKIRKYNSNLNKRFNFWRDTNPHATDKEVAAKRKAKTKAEKTFRTQQSASWNKQRKYLNTHKKYRIKTKYKALSFKPGTKGSAIINKIAKMSGIKIQKINLVYDRKYLNGYTAKKKPMNCIREIAADCKSNVYWKNGYLQIKDFVQQNKLSYVATKTTGLLSEPEYQEDSDTGQTWQLNVLFNPLITTGSVFQVKSETFSGWIITLSGNLTHSDGSTPAAQINVQLFSEYKKRQATAVAKKQKADSKTAKAKAKKDAAKRKQAKDKRTKRQKAKKHDDKKKAS